MKNKVRGLIGRDRARKSGSKDISHWQRVQVSSPIEAVRNNKVKWLAKIFKTSLRN